MTHGVTQTSSPTELSEGNSNIGITNQDRLRANFHLNAGTEILGTGGGKALFESGRWSIT